MFVQYLRFPMGAHTINSENSEYSEILSSINKTHTFKMDKANKITVEMDRIQTSCQRHRT